MISVWSQKLRKTSTVELFSWPSRFHVRFLFSAFMTASCSVLECRLQKAKLDRYFNKHMVDPISERESTQILSMSIDPLFNANVSTMSQTWICWNRMFKFGWISLKLKIYFYFVNADEVLEMCSKTRYIH